MSPLAAPRPCRIPRCPALVTAATPCPTHGRARTGRGSTWQWRLRRMWVLRAQPLCVLCLAAGRQTLAVEVDHLVPVHAGGRDDYENLQPLCGACHAVKTAQER